MVDGLRDVGGHVERYVIGHSVRESFADFRHLSLDIISDLNSVGTRKHKDVHHSSVAGVYTALGVVRLGLKRDSGDIPETDDRAIRTCPDNDVLELFDRRKPAWSRDRNGHIHIRDRLLSENSGSRLAVLILQGVLKILDRYSEAGHLVRLHPDLHRIIAASHVRNYSHTGDTPQAVLNIQGGVVAEINFIKFRVIRHHRDCHQLAGGLLFHRNAILYDFCRESGLRQLHPVLNLNRGQIRICGDVECQCR